MSDQPMPPPPAGQYPDQFGQQPTGQPYPAAPQGPPPGKTRNTVGLIALIAAIVGFIFACIPGALILGWILLPIGFILGIVGLFMSNQPKGTSIGAIVVAVIGTIVAAIVFVAVVADAVDEAFNGDGDFTVSGEQSGGDDGVGTQANPAALGAPITSGDWEVTVNEFTADATSTVLAANPFNDEPAAGEQYAVVNLTVTYLGEGSSYANEVSAAFVSDSGTVARSYDNPVVAPTPALDGELYNGGSATGNIVLQIPDDGAGLLRLNIGTFGNEVFVATN